MGYDGSVNIDTKLDTKGFNKGTKSISASLSGVMKSVAMVGKAMAAAFIGGSIISGIRSVIGSFDLMNSSIGGSLKTLNTSFTALKSSFASLVLTAFAPMIPYIITAVNWLTKLFTTLAQVTAALFGTSVAMANVKNETADAGKEAKKTAGALAGFDQINVLSKQDEGNTGSAAEVAQMIPVTQDILDKVQQIKDIIMAWWDDPAGMAKKAWEGFIDWLKTESVDLIDNLFPSDSEWKEKYFDPFAVGFYVFVDSTIELFKGMWETIVDDSLTFPEKIEAVFGLINDWLVSNFKPGIDNIINNLFPENASGESLRTNVLDPLSVGFFTFVESTKTLLRGLWETIFNDSLSLPEKIKNIFILLTEWFDTNFGNSIERIFSNTLESIGGKFESIFGEVKIFVKNVINEIIDYINGMIDGIIGGINTILEAANTIGGIFGGEGFSASSLISAPQIPHLATGAVIPPNSNFVAMLGDQRSGKNIEAPADLIRQMVAEGMQGNGGNQNINITFSGTMAELVRTLKPHIDKENTRVGGSLIRGGTST